jgi:hypothetical protein
MGKIKYWVTERVITIRCAWKTHPWLYTIPFAVGFLDMCPLWSNIINIVPGGWWITIWLLVIVIMLLDYSTSLRTRSHRAFLKFAKARLRQIDVLVEAHIFDLGNVKRETEKLNLVFIRAIGYESPKERIDKHLKQFFGAFSEIQHPETDQRMSVEVQRDTLRRLRSFSERLVNSTSPSDLRPEFDVSEIERIKNG